MQVLTFAISEITCCNWFAACEITCMYASCWNAVTSTPFFRRFSRLSAVSLLLGRVSEAKRQCPGGDRERVRRCGRGLRRGELDRAEDPRVRGHGGPERHIGDRLGRKSGGPLNGRRVTDGSGPAAAGRGEQGDLPGRQAVDVVVAFGVVSWIEPRNRVFAVTVDQSDTSVIVSAANPVVH